MWVYCSPTSVRDRTQLSLQLAIEYMKPSMVVGEAVLLPQRETGFYDNFQPLDEEDIKEIKADIEKLLQSEKYGVAWSE